MGGPHVGGHARPPGPGREERDLDFFRGLMWGAVLSSLGWLVLGALVAAIVWLL